MVSCRSVFRCVWCDDVASNHTCGCFDDNGLFFPCVAFWWRALLLFTSAMVLFASARALFPEWAASEDALARAAQEEVRQRFQLQSIQFESRQMDQELEASYQLRTRVLLAALQKAPSTIVEYHRLRSEIESSARSASVLIKESDIVAYALQHYETGVILEKVKVDCQVPNYGQYVKVTSIVNEKVFIAEHPTGQTCVMKSALLFVTDSLARLRRGWVFHVC